LFFTYDPGPPFPTGNELALSMGAYQLGAIAPGRTFTSLQGNPVAEFAEWGYTYYKIPPGAVIGDGTVRDNRDCYGPYTGCYDAGPTTKQEGYDRLHDYWLDHVPPNPDGGLLASINGHYFFQHYGATWGADIVMSEIGENIDSIQAHVAFTRGAAAQNGKPWGLDFSAWYGAFFRYYLGGSPFGSGVTACATCGHSDSLFERAYYLTYMSGASYLSEEGGGIYYWDGATASADAGPLPLSPIGKLAQEFAAFTRAHPDRGTPYVPTAVLLEENHGMGLGFWYQNLPWDYLSMDDGDYASAALFAQNLWPGSFEVMNSGNESGFLVNTGAFGDSIDVLLEDASEPVLQRYENLILSGDVTPSADLTSRLASFVQGGGSLVLQAGVAAQATTLYDALMSAGTGSGRLYLPNADPQAMQSTLQAIYAAKSPLIVNGNVEYLINRLSPSSFFVTLINNLGVTKSSTSPAAAVVDSTQAQSVSVSAAGGTIAAGSISVLHGGASATASGGGFSLVVEPGAVVIVQFSLGP
jgi:hypothetical protein